MNDLDIDLDRNTPWVDMSACVKFGLDRPSRLASHTEHRYRQTDKQTNKHIDFYYIDGTDRASLCGACKVSKLCNHRGVLSVPQLDRQLPLFRGRCHGCPADVSEDGQRHAGLSESCSDVIIEVVVQNKIL